VEIVDRIASSTGTMSDVEGLLRISEVMKDTSFCPLGQSLNLPVASSLKYFKDEILARVQ
jgi:NADH:ubiquinone oxidoreductase subunit F (NADH-binding)